MHTSMLPGAATHGARQGLEGDTSTDASCILAFSSLEFHMYLPLWGALAEEQSLDTPDL